MYKLVYESFNLRIVTDDICLIKLFNYKEIDFSPLTACDVVMCGRLLQNQVIIRIMTCYTCMDGMAASDVFQCCMELEKYSNSIWVLQYVLFVIA